METVDGKILVTAAELKDRRTFRQIDVLAAKALRDNCIEQSLNDMRSPATIAEGAGLLVVVETDSQPHEATGFPRNLVV